MGPKDRRHGFAVIALGIAASLIVVACGENLDPASTSGLDHQTPTLTVVLNGGLGSAQFSAAPTTSATVDVLWVKIRDICLQGDQSRQCLLDEPTEWIDVDGWMTLVEDVEVEPGTAQLRFIIAEAVLIAEGRVFATSAVDLTNDPPLPDLEAEGLLHCPSCSQSGIKVIFPGGEPMISEGENFLVAEFDVSESLGKERGKSGRWVMHPVIRGSLLLNARLTVEVVGEGGVTSSPAGIDCPDDCAANYPVGESVTLTAAAADGWSLVGWSGDCSGSETTAIVVLDINRVCTATFEEIPTEGAMQGTVSVDANATFDGSALPGSCGGLTVTADSLIKYFRPFISNGESRETATDPATGGYEFTTLTPGTYNLGWAAEVAFGSEALGFFQVVVTDPDGNPNDKVTEIVAGQTAIVNYSITEAFCSD
ncbi:MAG: DUF4382 domain-containing protein [Gemmatimonadales bacterium]